MLIELDRKNRFEPYEVGFINFWAYEDINYLFRNGNILYRGKNGQGKSVTMQSIIPILLDGNTAPKRIDPFGSKEKKIPDYLKVDGEVDTGRISYIYLTYKKALTGDTVTTGIGLRMINDSRYDFWGFVIKNKKIGSEFQLTKSIGYNQDGEEEFVPLSKRELKNEIEQQSCGAFAETQSEYVTEVNKNVFGFDTVKQLKELTDLLIQIRSPKLSKEMKPQMLYQALKSALPELPTSDYSMISSTIMDIEEHNEKLERTRTTIELTEALRKAYVSYRKKMLGNAAFRYKQATEELEEVVLNRKKTEDEIVNYKYELEVLQQRLRDIELGIKVKNNKLDSIEAPELRLLYNKKMNKSDEQLRKSEDLKKKISLLQNNKKNMFYYKEEFEKVEVESKIIEKEIHTLVNDLNRLSNDIQFVEGISYIAKAKESIENYKLDKDYFKVWLQRLNDHVYKLKKALEAWKEENRIQQEFMKKREEIREVDSQVEELELQFLKLQNEFKIIIDDFKVNLRNWLFECDEFYLNQLVIGEIITIAENLFEFEEMTPRVIENKLNDRKIELDRVIHNNKWENRARIKEINNKINEIDKEIKELEDQKEIVPYFRRYETEVNRKQLQSLNISYIPFYEAVDFKDNISDKEKERIESALLDMGILDSLIVPVSNHANVMKNDSVILPKDNKKNNLTNILIAIPPKSGSVDKQEIEKVLRSISLTTLEEGTFLTVDGEYQNGLIKGHAVLQEHASFIGEESRRRYRKHHIEKLKEQQLELKEVAENLEIKYNQLLDQEKKLESQFGSRPLLNHAEDKHQEKKQLLYQINKLIERREKLITARNDLNDSYQSKKINRIEATDFLVGTKDESSIHSILELAEREYRDEVGELRSNLLSYENSKTKEVHARQNLEIAEELVINLSDEITILEDDIKLIVEDLKTMEQQLEESGFKEKEKDIKQLRSEIDLLNKERDEKLRLEEKTKNYIEKIKEKIELNRRDVDFAKEQEIVQKEIFKLELKLNQIDVASELYEIAIQNAEKADISKSYKSLNDEVTNFRLNDLEGYLVNTTEGISGIKNVNLEEFPEKVDRIETIQAERMRLNVDISVQSTKMDPNQFYEYLLDLERLQESFLKQDEERLIKNVMIQGIGEKIRDLINKAKEWKSDINRLMKGIDNTIELRLLWEPIERTDRDSDDFLATTKLVELLSKDFETLKEKDAEALSKHFMAKINTAKDKLNRRDGNSNEALNLEEALKEVLDYRDWYKFKIMFTLPGRKESVLENMNTLSGGEKAMAIYIPLFSAAYSKYNGASKDAPYVIALDEAFAGVDDDNIEAMFDLMGKFGFNYILTSQALWADYPTVSGINIYVLHYQPELGFVYNEPWSWDGQRKTINEQALNDLGLYLDENEDFVGYTMQEKLFD